MNKTYDTRRETTFISKHIIGDTIQIIRRTNRRLKED